MAYRRSYEDEVNKIPISIFITNFPDQFYVKDLWKVCNQYGNVIDTFIPNRRTKLSKRFGFVCFIKYPNKGEKKAVLDVEDEEEDADSENGSRDDGPYSKNADKQKDVGGSMLQLVEDLVKVRQTMSPSAGYSGGILCVWDLRLFLKVNSVISNYFVMIRREWISNATTLDRYYSDHLNILLRETHVDYGPIPFGSFITEKIHALIKTKKENSNNQKKTLKAELAEIDLLLDKESMEVAQKVKIKWAIEGDENSKYYHGILNKKRSQLYVRSILVNGSSCLHLNIEFRNKLNMDQKIDLECDVTRDEIKRDVWDCETNKSFGLDGFSFGFNRRYWKFLEKDIEQAISYIFFHGTFPKGRVLGEIVNEVQYAFIANRKILDGPFILNEIYQWCKKKKKHTMIFKVDFEKAYDSVRWDYLDDVLKNFGFRDKWRGWIQSCLKSSRGSVIVNGSPTSKFQFYKVQRVVDANMIKGISICTPIQLSHLFYANDVVFMGQWSDLNIETIVQDDNGIDTSFWEEMWRGDTVFKSLYPRLYAFEPCKSITIAEKMGHENLVSSFRRHPRGGIKQEQFIHLFARLDGTTLVDMGDRRSWSLDGTGEFSIASIRKLIDESYLLSVSSKTR
nr:RNA-directed DNA polymerase, eukaryota, reverse transcriptase zinc-binding domain protein [Tanacetum cinerariifolium]